MIQVRVNRRAAERVAQGHPWIYSSDVEKPAGAQPGDVVSVADARGRRLGTAHYSSTSQIALRLLDRGVTAADRDFFLGRIAAAARFRERLVSDTEAYRLVSSEADRLPGLVVDRYGEAMVVQFLSQGMDRASEVIADCLEELHHPRVLVARNDAPARRHESLALDKRVLRGEWSGPVWVSMNGLEWLADLMEGQKTGLYLDQRENYQAAARYAEGAALDCFTSAGGFALHLARKAETVEAVDSSAKALATAEANAGANSITNVRFRQADVFELLAGYVAARRRFQIIVLDPPSFTKSKSQVAGALRGYRDLNYRALRLLGPGGVLVTCSCSHHVSEADLLGAVAAAAVEAGHTLRVLERRAQAGDHPILLSVPETHYLKCLILEVM